MDFKGFLCELDNNKTEYLLNEPMCKHTTFKIGGNADVLVKIKNETEAVNVIKSANRNNVPLFILGAGSNLLVSDKGIRGAVIKLCSDGAVSVSDGKITCAADVKLSKLCTAALENSLTGLEFAYGIPGSVGGALYMNAGAYGGDVSQVVLSAKCVDKLGNTVTVKAEDMELGYRTSVFKSLSYLITEVTFSLEKGDSKEIKAKMDELLARRKQKQPLEYPSAGSTFKRPKDNFAGTLIEKNNLKGVTQGGAKVSEKHAGFVINTGNATSLDVKNLIEKIKKTVLENDNILLETEVIFVGEEE